MADRFNISDQIAQARATDDVIERLRRETTPEQKRRLWRAQVRKAQIYYDGMERARMLARGEWNFDWDRKTEPPQSKRSRSKR